RPRVAGSFPVRPGAIGTGPGTRPDGVREPDDRELSPPRRRRVWPRRPARGCGGPEDPERAIEARGHLEEVVELEILRLVVREQGRDRVLDQVNPLTQI